MEEIVYYNYLYDIYGSLLTDKQKLYFEDYYFHNYSYSEIAEHFHVSRNAAFKQVHIVTQKLLEYEEKLMLLEKKRRILELVDSISDKKLKEQLEMLI